MIGRAGRALRLAVMFLTVLPVPWPSWRGEASEADLAASRYAFPVVGLALGLILAALALGLEQARIAPGVAAFLILAVWVGLSGGLHLDGLADTCDGLFLAGDPGRRLAAMRDPHLGSFGATALMMTLLGKAAALAALDGPGRARAALVAAAVGRTLVLVPAGVARYARPEGTGRILIGATTPREALAAALVATALGAALAGVPGLIASGLALLLARSLARRATQNLGGITGDILGATIELAELLVLLVLALAQPGGRGGGT